MTYFTFILLLLFRGIVSKFQKNIHTGSFKSITVLLHLALKVYYIYGGVSYYIIVKAYHIYGRLLDLVFRSKFTVGLVLQLKVMIRYLVKCN